VVGACWILLRQTAVKSEPASRTKPIALGVASATARDGIDLPERSAHPEVVTAVRFRDGACQLVYLIQGRMPEIRKLTVADDAAETAHLNLRREILVCGWRYRPCGNT